MERLHNSSADKTRGRQADTTRRNVLRAGVGALAVAASTILPNSAEARRLRDSVPLAHERLAAARAMARDIAHAGRDVERYVLSHYLPDSVRAGHRTLSALVAYLAGQEATMYKPSARTLSALSGVHDFKRLLSNIKPGSYGVYIDIDTQRMYVVRKRKNGRVTLVRGYIVSTSAADPSNRADSDGTPTGMHRGYTSVNGVLGQVVAGDISHYDTLVRLGHRHMVRTLYYGQGGYDPAAVITARISLSGKHTSPSRGIHIHGTNRRGILGKHASGGCIRMSNTDVTDLYHTYYARNKHMPIMLHWSGSERHNTATSHHKRRSRRASRRERHHKSINAQKVFESLQW